MDTRLRAEVHEEVMVLGRERDDFERRMENASMAREEMVEVAHGMAAQLGEMERRERELLAERESEREQAARTISEAERAQGEVALQLSEATRDKLVMKQMYEEAMVEVERQASVLTSLEAKRSKGR